MSDIEEVEQEVVNDALRASDGSGVESLPRVGFALRSLHKRREELIKYRDAEIQRIDACVTDRISRIDESVAILTANAEAIMTEAGDKRIQYPGVGTFAFQKGRESVDTSVYDAMGNDEKGFCHMHNPELFATDVKVRPDKKKIKELLISGDEIAQQVFAMTISDEKFTFKME